MKIASRVISVAPLDHATDRNSCARDDRRDSNAGRGKTIGAGDGMSDACSHHPTAGRAEWTLLAIIALVLPTAMLPALIRGGDRPALTPEPSVPGEPPPSPPRDPLLFVQRDARRTAPPTRREATPIEAADARSFVPKRPVPTEATLLRVEVIGSNSGRSIPHASVELRWLARSGEERLELRNTDEHGRLVLEAAPGRCTVVAWAGSQAGGPAIADLIADRTTTLRVSLASVREIAGRVVDADSGAPIQGAAVSFWTFAELDRVRTGADGVFRHPRFPSATPAQQVRVEAPGYGSTVRYVEIDAAGRWFFLSPTGKDNVASAGGDPWVEIELVHELVVRGTVVDLARRPIAGARVSAEGFYHILPSVASRDEAMTITDEHGHFQLDGLRSDIGHGLQITANGFSQAKLELDPSPFGPMELGELTLEPELLLTGVVLAPDGLPAADIAVELRLHRQPTEPDSDEAPSLDANVRVRGMTATVRSSPEGTFLFEGLRPGRYELRVARDREALHGTTFDLEEIPATGLIIHLPQDSFTLEGEVRDSGGQVVPDAVVRVSRFGHVGLIKTNADGRFRISGLDAEASYELAASVACPETGDELIAHGSAWGFDHAVLRLGER